MHHLDKNDFWSIPQNYMSYRKESIVSIVYRYQNLGYTNAYNKYKVLKYL